MVMVMAKLCINFIKILTAHFREKYCLHLPLPRASDFDV